MYLSFIQLVLVLHMVYVLKPKRLNRHFSPLRIGLRNDLMTRDQDWSLVVMPDCPVAVAESPYVHQRSSMDLVMT